MSNARKLADNLPTDGQLSGRNVIINGEMMIAQRQTSSSNVGNKYVLDRFYVYKQNTGSTYTCSQNSVTDLAGFNNSLKMDCTTADTSTASNEEVYIQTKLEGQNLQRFRKGHSTALGFTLSFYVKTNKTGVYTVKMYDRDNNRDVSGSYTVADTNWNRYTISFPADTTGKFDDDNGSSLEIFFNLVRGSDSQGGTLNTAWRTNADASCATGQINFADSTSNNWEITGIQLEAGSQSTPFEHEPYETALRKCQRYLSILLRDDENDDQNIGSVYSATRCFIKVFHKVTMRTTPTISLVGAIAANLYSNGSSVAASGINASYPKKDSTGLDFTPSSSLSGGTAFHLDWATSDTARYVKAEAEL